MRVSIIMPVYNAASTLHESLESIKSQTFRDFELVCVNDCSKDGSAALLEEYAGRVDFPVKVISHEVNQGAAAARNTGIDAASGEWLAFVDADDLMAPRTLEKALKTASDSEADIVGWDWLLSLTKNERYMRQADFSTPLDALKNMMSGVMRWNLWLFLSKKSLWDANSVRFIPGMNMGEDMMVMHKLFCNARSVCQIHEALYHYNAVNVSSISRQFSESNRMQVSANVAEVERYVSSSRYSDSLEDYVGMLKLNIKLPLLVSGSKYDYRLWGEWYPESDAFVMANKSLPLRKRLLQKAASLRLWPVVKAYYLLVEKIFYGIIFR